MQILSFSKLKPEKILFKITFTEYVSYPKVFLSQNSIDFILIWCCISLFLLFTLKICPSHWSMISEVKSSRIRPPPPFGVNFWASKGGLIRGILRYVSFCSRTTVIIDGVNICYCYCCYHVIHAVCDCKLQHQTSDPPDKNKMFLSWTKENVFCWFVLRFVVLPQSLENKLSLFSTNLCLVCSQLGVSLADGSDSPDQSHQLCFTRIWAAELKSSSQNFTFAKLENRIEIILSVVFRNKRHVSHCRMRWHSVSQQHRDQWVIIPE